MNERREYYRVTCLASVELGNKNSQTPLETEFDIPAEYQLLNEFRSLNVESAGALKQISDENKNLGNFLKIMSKKIDLLANAVVSQVQRQANTAKQHIDIGEGGIKFVWLSHLQMNANYPLKLVLYPENILVLCTVKIISCHALEASGNKISGEGFSVSAEFQQIDTVAAQLISKFVIQQQRRMLNHKIKEK